MALDSAQTPEEGIHLIGQSEYAPALPPQEAANVASLQGTHLEVDVMATIPVNLEVY
jgi:hypothetical protein